MKQNKYRSSFKKWLNRAFLIVVFAACLFFLTDYRGPSSIAVREDVAFGFSCLRAHDLIVQEYDAADNLWATRGMTVYCLKKGENEFTRVAHIPTGFTIYWIRNFSFIRKLTLRSECVEFTVTDNGDYYAFSAGHLWLMKKGERRFRDVLKLSHYGLGDQGIRNDGILNYNDTSLYLAEYFTNPGRERVNIFDYKKTPDRCNVAMSFPPGRIRHVHAIQKDPFTGKIWICTGDSDEESFIAWTDDGLKTIHTIISGSQAARACQLVFTESSVLWGTDSGAYDNPGIYKWDKSSGKLINMLKTEGAMFYATRLKNGTKVFSMDREGLACEKDKRTKLFIVSVNDSVRVFEGGAWNHNKKGFFFKYALLRLQRNQGGPSLAITCLNQKEFPDGELLLLSEETLLKGMK